METNTENHIKVREARSYARCIKLGLSTAADHAGVVWTHTWPSVLLSLVLAAGVWLAVLWPVFTGRH